ncbi:MAG: branched chain amino acid aminotransferase, partial [Saprospiraceae bacterium]
DEVVAADKNGKLREVFGTGTAAVIAEVAKIKYNDTIIELNPNKYVTSKLAKSIINGLRSRKIEDKFGWIVEAQSAVTC